MWSREESIFFFFYINTLSPHALRDNGDTLFAATSWRIAQKEWLELRSRRFNLLRCGARSGRILINARIAAPLLLGSNHRLCKKKLLRMIDEGPRNRDAGGGCGAETLLEG